MPTYMANGGLYAAALRDSVFDSHQAKGVPTRPGKVPLEKGYSQLDWMRLSRNEDMSGASTYRSLLV